MTEVDFEHTFSANLLVAGFSAIWCADFRIPCLFRIDPADFAAEPFIDLPPHDDEWGRNLGPASLAIGPDAVWVLERSGSVLRVDPVEGTISSIESPFPFSEVFVGAAALFGIEQFGEGRIARLSFEGDVRVASVGRALRLLDCADDLVWTVDDAESTVLAISAQSLDVVRRFNHIGGPDALWAGERRAWYLASREVMHGEERVAILTRDGVPCDFLRLEVESGTAQHLTTLNTTVPATARDPEGFWISGSIDDDFEDDPLSRVWLVDKSGEIKLDFELRGQVDSLCRDSESLWISGFRRSLQRQMISHFSPTGSLIDESDMSSIDVSRWIPEPQPIEWPPLDTWAASVRDVVEVALTSPATATFRDGSQHEVPSICDEFGFERTELRLEEDSAFLDVVFSWEGESGLFGRTFPLVQQDWLAGAPDAYVTVYLQEVLLAAGLGIENAERHPRDGVTWLTWHPWDDT